MDGLGLTVNVEFEVFSINFLVITAFNLILIKNKDKKTVYVLLSKIIFRP